MTTWAVIPVKPLNVGKSRLGGILSDIERVQLNEFMLHNTIYVLKKVKAIENVLIVSRDKQVLEIARQAGAIALLENENSSLNKALYQATNTLNKYIDRIIVIPTDLPLITAEDVDKLLEQGCKPPVVVVVPDRNNNGTNALLVYPAGSIRYRFGQHSSAKHVEEAHKRGIRVILSNILAMGLDLDVPEDLELIKSRGYIIPIQPIKSVEEKVI
jgi:2-phospho-L-lactate guanylyltransferase